MKNNYYLAKSALTARQVLASLTHGPYDSDVANSDQMLNNLNGVDFFKNLLQLQKLKLEKQKLIRKTHYLLLGLAIFQ
jgi:hypothetical protein